MKLPATFAELLDLAELTAAPTSVGPSPVMLPLSPRHRAVSRVIRPGAFDYRDIPSRHGDMQVPYKSSVTLDNESKRG